MFVCIYITTKVKIKHTYIILSSAPANLERERITRRELLETLQRSDFICMKRKFGNTGAKMITYL